MQSPKQYFENHAGVSEFFFTADGLAFFDKNTAESHANSLTEKAVKKITREEAENEVEEENESDVLIKKIATAQKAVDKAEGVVAAKQAAFDKAAEPKKAAAKTALNEAVVYLAKAKEALEALQPDAK